MTAEATAACSGKRRFNSFNAAQAEAIRIRRKRHLREKPYHCAHCGAYHVGSPFGLKRRPAAVPAAHDPE